MAMAPVLYDAIRVDNRIFSVTVSLPASLTWP